MQMETVAPPQADRITCVFSAHEAEIRRFLNRLVRDAEISADLTAETFCRLVVAERAGRFPDQPRAWLYRVASNLATSHGRRRAIETRAMRRLQAQRSDGTAASAEEHVIRRERCAELETALTPIRGDGRLALLMSAAGFPGSAIAARTGRTHGATRTLLSRSRVPIRRRLAELRSGAAGPVATEC